MISPALRAAFAFHREHKLSRLDRTARTASAALCFARQDVASGLARYPEGPRATAVAYQSDNHPARADFYGRRVRAERFAYVPDPEAIGLRLVGEVTAESHRSRRETWNTGADKGGWYTDPHGDVFRDGSGLCFGVVYQLPTRGGRLRFVAGYQFGGVEGGPTLELGEVFTCEAGRDPWNNSNRDTEAALDAAVRADSHAEHAAEAEREYQTAWSAGARFYELGEEMKASRTEVLALLQEVKPLRKGPEAGKLPHACKALLSDVRGQLREIAKARLERAALLGGEYGELSFPTSGRPWEAFQDNAQLPIAG